MACWNAVATVDTFVNEELPYKDYHQYTVSISWSQNFEVAEGLVTEHYSYQFVYWWDDRIYTSPEWNLRYVVVKSSNSQPH